MASKLEQLCGIELVEFFTEYKKPVNTHRRRSDLKTPKTTSISIRLE